MTLKEMLLVAIGTFLFMAGVVWLMGGAGEVDRVSKQLDRMEQHLLRLDERTARMEKRQRDDWWTQPRAFPAYC